MKYVIKSKRFLSKADLHILLTEYSFILVLHPVHEKDLHLCKNTNVFKKTCNDLSSVYAHIIDDNELSNVDVIKSSEPMRLASYYTNFNPALFNLNLTGNNDIRAVLINIHKDNLICNQQYVKRYLKCGKNLSLAKVKEDAERIRNYIKRKSHV